MTHKNHTNTVYSEKKPFTPFNKSSGYDMGGLLMEDKSPKNEGAILLGEKSSNSKN